MRGAQLARQWKIIRLLESRKRGLTINDLSDELDAPARTVYRDLEALQEAGFPLYSEKEDRQAYWKFVAGYKPGSSIPFTTTELMSLHMSRDVLKIFEGTVFQESIESLFEKIRASLLPETIRYLENISGRLKVGFGPPKNYRNFKEIIFRLSEAAAKRKQVEILYKAASTGKETIRKVDPYQVWAMNGSFYLIGKCHVREAIRTFAMDRIKELKVLDQLFTFPKDFSLEEYLQTAFRVMRGKPETVKVYFRPGAAQVVKERIWHPSQEIREQADGSLTITLEVPINYEIVSWILGFGSATKVLAPTSLKKRIQEELQATLESYQSDSLPTTKVLDIQKMPAHVS
jgi:predicted DNA-binding transcriptional regulator YafY